MLISEVYMGGDFGLKVDPKSKKYGLGRTKNFKFSTPKDPKI